MTWNRAERRTEGCNVKTTAVLILSLLILPASAVRAVDALQDDAIFRAMQDELNRSSSELAIPGMNPPYFLSYRVREHQGASLEARYTAVTDSSTSRERNLLISLRVGDPGLDNTNFYQDWRNIWVSPGSLVDENNYDALRHQIWFQTDTMYKKALEMLAGKKAYLQANPPKKVLADFAPAERFVSVGPTVPLTADRQEASRCVRLAANALREGSDLQDWRVTWSRHSTNQWYVNSEGSRHRKRMAGQTFDMSATLQAEDGQRLTGFVSYLLHRDDGLPPTAKLAEDARRLATDLRELASAPLLDEYVGPVLFTDVASAQFIDQLFAAQLTLVRKPLTTEEWMKQRLPVGKLATKLKRRVFPSFVTIQDQPKLETWGGKRLVGTAVVDDEGVECRDITLVEKGRLVNLPLGRQPVEGLERSNGHSRSTAQQMTVPGITNLLVTSSDPLPPEKMLRALRNLCREQGIEYGLLVRKLEDPRFSDLYRTTEREEESQPELLAPPLLAYRVYAADGRVEPVRGLGFDAVSVRSLRDITALGADAQVYNLLHPVTGFGGYQQVSVITPSILVEEMELKSAGVHEPLTVEKNPIFD
jgi:predicted Zn-dependent protease